MTADRLAVGLVFVGLTSGLVALAPTAGADAGDAGAGRGDHRSSPAATSADNASTTSTRQNARVRVNTGRGARSGNVEDHPTQITGNSDRVSAAAVPPSPGPVVAPAPTVDPAPAAMSPQAPIATRVPTRAAASEPAPVVSNLSALPVPTATAAVASTALDVLDALSGGWLPAGAPAIATPALAAWTGQRASAQAARVVGTQLSAAAPPDPAASLPALPTNGVTGVQVGHASLEIPCGPNGYRAPADWYFPTQADGTVKAQGVIWLQHGFLATKDFYRDLATQLATETNSIVVAPTLTSFPLSCAGCWVNGAPMQHAIASLFLGGETALNNSAAKAGFEGTLPTSFVLAGHSAGGGVATAVASYTVDNGAADNRLRGVVMFDGVSNGAFDGSFTKQLATLDTEDIPVYQIAAMPQMWNAFGATTNQLLAARPDQFDGAVLVGGSHVDAMLGNGPFIDLVLQLVAGISPAGNTAATRTLSTGWINDLYVGATPNTPQFGFYAAANQQIIMGNAAAVALPTPTANQLDPIAGFLRSVTDAIFTLVGIPPTPPVNTGPNGVSALVIPPKSNGVTGVKTGSSTLTIPSGNGYNAPADWYFPTQADGSVNANGVIWLQHGFFGVKDWYSDLATQLAQQTNSIVVAPQVFWFDDAFSGQAAAELFVGTRPALNISANAAGFQGALPEKFVLTGHSTGGNFVTTMGAGTVDNGAAANLLGVVMFDGVARPEVFAPALAKLDSLAIPEYQIAAPPQNWNARGETTAQLAALHPGEFIGVMIDKGSHTDSVSGNWLADLASALLVKPSPPGGKAAVRTFASGWINDLYSGSYGPADPGYGIYGNPNDGAYVPAQAIVMGNADATTLPVQPPAV